VSRAALLLAVLLIPASGFAARLGTDAVPAPTPPPRPAPPHQVTAPLQGTMPVVSQSGLALTFQRTAPSSFTPAPVPNLDLTPPPPRPSKASAEFSGSLFSSRNSDNVANGYMDGSKYSSDLERRSRPALGSTFAPTIGLKIPLE
jgi:hypothetical protein